MAERIRRKVISLAIDQISYQDALVRIVNLAKSKTRGYVCFANVHMTIEAHLDKSFASQVNGADLVLADGMPLVKTIESLYKQSVERSAGMDMLPDLIAYADREHLKVLFFGTTMELLDKIKSRILAEHPGLSIAGLISPPFNKSLDDPGYFETINSSQADIVFVALGCPKQEKWMASHSHKINSVLLGVGGAFPVYAGTTKRAPDFMRNNSIEWIYRLYQEPRRLFKRYFFTNSLFLWLVTKEKLARLFHRPPN